MNDFNHKEFRISRPKQILSYFLKLPCYPFFDFFYRVLNKSKAIGLNNLPANRKGVLIASNHVSGIDTTLIPLYSINKLSTTPFVAPAKEELFKVPLLGHILSAWGAFPVKRRARDISSMRRIAYYANNYQVMLFPEGTRSKTGKLLKGRAGAGWVVYKSRPVVVPTLVINTQHYFWPGRTGPWFGVPYRVVFGNPMDLTQYYKMPECKETSQKIADAIMKEIRAMKEKHKDLYI
ncbi:MAG TPA: lysophospholipid acyltransferase family protein [Nitrospinota bacterium]|nr:lysophospholipid acyltransferase family protein [Nitrospinota bacterium]|tara:strand:+ start:154959 stop:155663 length:705 start_codon:yes stop_codon:yes gene_type:complete